MAMLRMVLILCMLMQVLNSPNNSDVQTAALTKPLADGDSTGWFTAAQANLQNLEYEVTWQDHTLLFENAPAFQAANRAHNLRVYFLNNGLRLFPREAGGENWSFNMDITGWGRPGRVQVVDMGPPQVLANRVRSRQANELESWYVNTPAGLQQGFTVYEAPASIPFMDKGAFVLQLAVKGDLNPMLRDDSQSLEWFHPKSSRVLNWGNLHASDITGRALPARMDLSPLSDGWQVTLTVEDDLAIYPLTIDLLFIDYNSVYFGDQAGARLGASVSSAGDVNGDGYSDIILSADHYDNGEEDEGRAFVYNGSFYGLKSPYNWSAEGNQIGALFGSTVSSAGDVNGDGYSDIIIGAPFLDNAEADAGYAFAYYGSGAGLSKSSSWSMRSSQAGASFGSSISSAGDVNGDGYSDVIVGAPFFDHGEMDEGSAYLYYGSTGGLSAAPAWVVESNVSGARFGFSVSSAGDVNGDGYSDVIVGAPGLDHGAEAEGGAFVYFGSASGLSPAPAWMTESNQPQAQLGFSVSSAGDVNGDGFSEVLIGANTYDHGETDEGRVLAYYGSASGLPQMAQWTVEGNQAAGAFGYAVSSAGDVNGDGYSDVIIGAPLYDQNEADEGVFYVYLGSPSGLGASPGLTTEINQAGAAFGSAVSSAGDVNGDGYSDVIVGAYMTNVDKADEGSVYIYHGWYSKSAWLDGRWKAEGDQVNAWFGSSVSSTGDVNNDGYSDVIVSAPYFDNGEGDEGRAFVYYGSTNGLNQLYSWSAEGDQAGALFGYMVSSAGDVNGDGFSDVLIGAPGFDHGEADEGRVYAYYGSTNGLSISPNWIAESNQPGAEFGKSINSAGNVNGDKFSDVIIGAPGFDKDGVDDGIAYVYYGSSSGLGALPDWSMAGGQAGTHFGETVTSAGDVNGDGYSDVIIGKPLYIYFGSANGLSGSPGGNQLPNLPSSQVSSAGDVNGDGYSDVMLSEFLVDKGYDLGGRVYVYFGSNSGLSASPNWWKEETAGDFFGSSLSSAGDINGDGYSDVIIGTEDAGNNVGEAFIYSGSASGLAEAPTWIDEGDQAGSRFGYSVSSAGDVNGDGYSDVIIGASMFDNGEMNEGRAYVYYGKSGVLGVKPDWAVESNASGARIGFSVSSAGDVNSDGFSDVIVGAPFFDHGEMDEGVAFVYYGSAGGLSAAPTWAVESNVSGARFGFSVSSAGDVNGDGYSDVIVGAPGFDHGAEAEGGAFVYFGSASGLSPTPAWMAESDQPQAQLGFSVSSAGDVNGDGFSDVLIGASTYDHGETDEGHVFAYYGSASGLRQITQWTAEGNQAAGAFGYAVSSAGDVNGDGYSDVVVGAPFFENGEVDEGVVHVYLGSPSGLGASPGWTAESNQAGAAFGSAVSSAGDVDGDGYNDVIIGAPSFDNGEGDEGRAFVYYGYWNGWKKLDSLSAESDQAGAHFGGSVSSAGDVNGDGFSDVLIGAPGFDHGEADEGRVYAYFGSAIHLSHIPSWTAESNVVSAEFGSSVSSARDMNGDTYSDVIIGAAGFMNGEAVEGRATVYYGKSIQQLFMRPRQVRSDGSTPVALLGSSGSIESFTICLDSQVPGGRNWVRLEWQVLPLGKTFNDVNSIIKGSGQPRISDGMQLCETVKGLAENTPYHWRARLRYLLVTAEPAGRWITNAINGFNETDLRTLSRVRQYLPVILRN